ncbi:MAG: hypothetical protein ABR506_12835, partial [Candidatus Krumholzibacteriia bacterium]
VHGQADGDDDEREDAHGGSGGGGAYVTGSGQWCDGHGRRVGEVAVEVRGGLGEAAWEARDAAGRALPAGVYLARAEGVPGRPGCRVAYVP